MPSLRCSGTGDPKRTRGFDTSGCLRVCVCVQKNTSKQRNQAANRERPETSANTGIRCGGRGVLYMCRWGTRQPLEVEFFPCGLDGGQEAPTEWGGMDESLLPAGAVRPGSSGRLAYSNEEHKQGACANRSGHAGHSLHNQTCFSSTSSLLALGTEAVAAHMRVAGRAHSLPAAPRDEPSLSGRRQTDVPPAWPRGTPSIQVTGWGPGRDVMGMLPARLPEEKQLSKK